MTNNLATLGSYQLSTIGAGAVVAGLDNIRQCIDLILRTIKGSDPLRPEFGCDVFQYMDKPANVAIPNMKKAIFEALTLWESRITVTAISHVTDKSNLSFNITYVTPSGNQDTLRFAINASGDTQVPTTTGIIISANIPTYITNGRYFIAFTVGGIFVTPNVPLQGFNSTAEMLAWVNANWSNYGRWYVTGEKLVLYLAQNITQTVSLTVTQTVLLTLKEQLFDLAPGEFYEIDLTLNGVAQTPAFPTDSINNVEALLSWLQNNWPFGVWSLQSVSGIGGDGDFNNDFNDDFNNSSDIAGSRFLVFQSADYSTGVLTIN